LISLLITRFDVVHCARGVFVKDSGNNDFRIGDAIATTVNANVVDVDCTGYVVDILLQQRDR
jgi:hypothetical protein